MTLRTFSYGGGVQSTAALVLAAQGKIDFSVFIFANTGNDSEDPRTLRYVESVAKPYAAMHGIELVEVTRAGATLYQELTETDRDLIPWQIKMTRSETRYGDAMALSRTCTSDWKIKAIASEQAARGATKDEPAVTGLGISLDELHRMRTDSGIPWQVLEYPLVEMRLDRQDCINIIVRAGLPEPMKSACWFCAYKSLHEWRRMRDERPDEFARAVELERMKSAARVARGAEPIYFHRKLQPIDVLTATYTSDMFDDIDDTCESGFCMV